MIVVRLSGGMGNQMFQFAAAFALSERTGNPIQLDTSYFANDEFKRRYSLDAFKLGVSTVGTISHIRFRILAKLAQTCFHRFLPAPNLVEDREEGYNPALFEVSCPVILSGYWQSYRYFDDVEASLREKFKFQKVAPPAVASWIKQIEANSNATALHVRRCDYVTNPEAARVHGCCDVAYYQRAVDQLLANGIKPELFVFSDDPEWAQTNLKLGVTAHLVSGQGDWPDDEELRMMSACRHFIIANSSFSWWAAWLGRASEKVVIAPARWYTGRQPPLELMPPKWVCL